VDLVGDRGSVISLATTRGRLVPFAVPDTSLTTQVIDEPDLPRGGGNGEVRGRLDDVDGLITWSYDSSAEAFEVDDVDDDDNDDDDD
jgi:hypothetical protein